MDVKHPINRTSVMTDIVQSVAWGLRRLDGPVAYPPLSAAPYSPHEAYPEFPSLPLGEAPSGATSLSGGARFSPSITWPLVISSTRPCWGLIRPLFLF